VELGKIIGQVVSTARHHQLPNMTFLLIDIVDVEGIVKNSSQVAVDNIGAGLGELVMLTRGSSARITLDDNNPIDLSVIGIVDQVTSGQITLYTK